MSVLPQWPASVPYEPLREAYEIPQRHPSLIVTEMEDGPKRQRSASSADWSQHSYQIVMTEVEFAAFDQFAMRDLVRGSGRFMMRVGRFYTAPPWPLKLVYIEGGNYTVKPFGAETVVVTFTLNVLDW